MRLSGKSLAFLVIGAMLASCSGGRNLPSAPDTAQSAGQRQSLAAARATRPSPNAMIGNKPIHALLPRNASGTKGASNDLVYHGGPIQKNPVVYVVFWGFTSSSSDPSGVAPYLISFLKGMSGTSYFDIVTQYYSNAAGNVNDPVHEYSGAWYDNTSVPNQPSDTQIANEAIRAAAHFGYNYDASYVVQLPHGAYNNLKWCAYHSVTKSSNGDVHYTNLPYQPDFPGCGTNSVNSGAQGQLDSTSETVAHEVAETQTDPDTSTGWYDAYGNEIGDYCSYINLQNIKLSTGTFATQPLWSNAAHYCAISYP